MHIATTPWDWANLDRAESLCAQAETAEDLGLHSFWLPENHFGGKRAIPSPLTLLAAVAARTERIGLGCTSYLLPIRHPLQAAEEVAVLDRLSGGRLILGLGRGMQKQMFQAFDVDARQKRSLFASHLQTMRMAWRGDSVLDVQDAKPIVLTPLPVQQEIPLWVAAFGPLALKQVAQLGLPYLASPMETLDQLAENYAFYREQLLEAGHAAPEAVPIMRTVLVTQSDSELRSVRTALEDELRARGIENPSMEQSAIVGDRSYVAEKLDEYAQRLRVTHLIVRSGLSDVSAQRQIENLGELMALGNFA